MIRRRGARSFRLGCAASALLSSLSFAGPCLADESEPSEDHPPVRLAVLGGTEFPMGVGASVRAELPHRLRASLGVSVLPGPYVAAIHGFLDVYTTYVFTPVVGGSVGYEF